MVNRGTVGVNSLPKTVTRRRHSCDLNPGPEFNTLTTLGYRANQPNARMGILLVQCKLDAISGTLFTTFQR